MLASGAYRKLSPAERRHVVVVLKTGTYDDTVGSHFVAVDPANPGSLEDDDIPILDPDQPAESPRRVWRLSDSSRRMRQNPDLRLVSYGVGIRLATCSWQASRCLLTGNRLNSTCQAAGSSVASAHLLRAAPSSSSKALHGQRLVRCCRPRSECRSAGIQH